MPTWKSTVEALRLDAKANGSGVAKGYFLTNAVHLMVHFRFAQFWASMGPIGKVIAKLLWLRMVRRTGCHFSLRASIAGGLCLPHPTAIVIGDGVVIEGPATIFQGVTLGHRGGNYPHICQGASIYPGAVVIGQTRVGVGATVGALSYVSRDVADQDTVVGAPARSLPAAAADQKIA